MVVTEVAEDEAGRMLARREVELLLNGRGWNIADLGRATGVDLGTIGDFLNVPWGTTAGECSCQW